ncbi:DUF4817 domain-containing protein [Trichonephila clavipes]|nr:DUF4817 domain-containing protein [Trichonephila clavipes]
MGSGQASRKKQWKGLFKVYKSLRGFPSVKLKCLRKWCDEFYKKQFQAVSFANDAINNRGYQESICAASRTIDRVMLHNTRTVHTEEAIATVERSIEEDPNESIRHRAQELDLCPSTLWKILRKDLGLRAYKIQLVQELKPNDHQARRRFVEWAQNEIAVVPDFHKRILFSDEAHFWLNGYVNKQNCRIWSEANPQVYVETPLHPEKLTVWCALWAGGILLQKR